MSKSLDFPNMFYKNSTKVIEDEKAIKNNLSLMLQCEKGEQFGDPDFGVNLAKSKFKTNPALAKELVVDGVIESQKFVNNVLFYRDNVKLVKNKAGRFDITINALFSSKVNLHDLVLISDLELE